MRPVRKNWTLLGIVVATIAAGCSGGSDNDPNYSTKISLTPEQQAAEKANMAGQKAPGAAPDRGGGVPSAVMPMPPGKGKR